MPQGIPAAPPPTTQDDLRTTTAPLPEPPNPYPTLDHPVPEDAPTVHAHSRNDAHRMRLGEPIDTDTLGPYLCSCGDCVRARSNLADVRRRATERDNMRRAGVRRQNELRAAGVRECRACGFNCMPACSRCGRCTPRGITEANLRDIETIYVQAPNWVDDVIELARGREGADRQNYLMDRARSVINFHCDCLICATCAQPLIPSWQWSPGDGGERACEQHHHVGCDCTCWTCSHCSRTLRARPIGATTCTTCNATTGCCCRCAHCATCQTIMPGNGVVGPYGEQLAGRCQNCNNCIDDCCRCIPSEGAEMPTVSSRPGVVYQRARMKKWEATDKWGLVKAGIPKPDQLVPYTRLIGNEIECGGNGTTGLNLVVVRRWKGAIVGDGSLPATGFEINTAPAAGDKYVQQMRDLEKEFQRTNVWVNYTCGLHTHIDVSDFSIWDLRRLINLYRRVEEPMFGLLPYYRRNNTYCLPCGDNWWKVFNDPGKIREIKNRTESGPKTIQPPTLTGSLKGKLTSALYGRNPNDPNVVRNEKTRKQVANEIKKQKRGKGNELRYRALNVHSAMLRGTLEFRHGAPSPHVVAFQSSFGSRNSGKGRVAPDVDYMMNWSVVCASVVEAARNLSDAEVDKLPFGKAALPIILPNDKMRTWAKDIAEVVEKTKNAKPQPPEARFGAQPPPQGDEDEDREAHEDSCDCFRCDGRNQEE